MFPFSFLSVVCVEAHWFFDDNVPCIFFKLFSVLSVVLFGFLLFSPYFLGNNFNKPMNPVRIRVFLFACAAAWCSMIVAAPLLAHAGGPYATVARGLYAFFSGICHQLDNRSLHLFGFKLAVCARCAAVYLSFFLAIMFNPVPSRPFRRIVSGNERRFLIAGAMPMLLDVALAVTGIHHSTAVTRVVTGFLFGASASLILIPQLQDGLAEIILTFRQRSSYASKAQ